MISNFGKEEPEIFLIDYRLPGGKNGIELAIEILTKNPSMPILFITAYEPLKSEIVKYPIFRGKKIQILLKPVTLPEIEITMLSLVSNNKFDKIPG